MAWSRVRNDKSTKPHARGEEDVNSIGGKPLDENSGALKLAVLWIAR